MVDLDGTLARTTDANWEAYGQALREVGVSMSSEQFHRSVQGRNWREFLPEMLSDAQVEADPEAIAKRKTDIYKSLLPQIIINLPLVRLIETARHSMGMKTALVTSASRANVIELLRAHDLTVLFDEIVTGDDVQRHKPDPEAYAMAAGRLGVRPEECLVYEDAEVGVASATAFGAHVIRVIF